MPTSTKRRIQQEFSNEDGWTDWIRPIRRGYLLACCDCGLVHELQFDTVKRTPFKHGKLQEYEPVRGDAIFRARRKPRLTAQHRKETKMPAILERLVSQLKAKGHPEKAAYAIATSQLQKSGNLKKGTNKATTKGKRRGAMTPAARAKDRAVKYGGGKTSDYKYNAKTNTTKKK